jgi:prepilin-type processing-associated H-X9-DG protein
MLPSRASASQGQSAPDKWPTLLSKYLSDVRIYASSFDTQNWIIRHLTPTQAVSNDANNTSYIMNGYNDQNTFNNPNVQIRVNSFATKTNTILLGTPIIGSRQFYMDFEEAPNGNENDVLQLAAYNGGSNYLFADGSARFITKAAYQAPSPDATISGTNESYGNWLWKVDKTYQIPVLGNPGS